MYKLLSAVLVAFLAMYSTAALADGNKLLTECSAAVRVTDGDTNPGNAADISFCLGFMQGITYMNGVYQLKNENASLFCLPENGINNGQAARIVTKYLRDHPQELHKDASFLAVMAFMDAYPCGSPR